MHRNSMTADEIAERKAIIEREIEAGSSLRGIARACGLRSTASLATWADRHGVTIPRGRPGRSCRLTRYGGTLNREAARRGMSTKELATLILDTVLADDLVEAVLDDR